MIEEIDGKKFISEDEFDKLMLSVVETIEDKIKECLREGIEPLYLISHPTSMNQLIGWFLAKEADWREEIKVTFLATTNEEVELICLMTTQLKPGEVVVR